MRRARTFRYRTTATIIARWICLLMQGMNALHSARCAVHLVYHRLGTAFEPPWTVVLRGSVHAVPFIPRRALALYGSTCLWGLFLLRGIPAQHNILADISAPIRCCRFMVLYANLSQQTPRRSRFMDRGTSSVFVDSGCLVFSLLRCRVRCPDARPRPAASPSYSLAL